jgi:hypothetical protein
MKFALCILALLVDQAHAADRLPKAMLGAWASDPAACGEQASELAMTVEPKTVLFYEHGFKIRRVVRLKDGTWRATGYSVDDDGRAPGTLSLKLVADRLQVNGGAGYYRCNKKIGRKA